MKKLILKRIEEIRIAESNFNRDTMRWKNFTHGQKHITEINFEEMNKADLLFLFERLIVQCRKQM
jgi:hypothetical protein